MATASVSDIVEEAIAERDAEGVRVTRVFHVTGFTGAASQRPFEAETATGIPTYGSAHPDIAPLLVVNKSVRMIDADNARVVVTYRRPRENQKPDPADNDETPTLTMSVSLVEITSNKDATGADILVTYDGISQSAEVTKQLPLITFRLSRREQDHPTLRALDCVGKLNNASFTIGGQSLAAGTVLCSNISTRTDDNSETFFVEYEFQYFAAGWEVVVYYIDPDTGRPPADLVAGTGIKPVPVYEEEDFAVLDV
jgi:hypothetical protein